MNFHIKEQQNVNLYNYINKLCNCINKFNCIVAFKNYTFKDNEEYITIPAVSTLAPASNRRATISV